MLTAKQEAAVKVEREREKRARQAEKKKAAAAASIFKMACIGSSDSDGFVCVDIKDVKSFADKASDDEIQRIEQNLA
eukprot:1401610-Amphidinium_carterae.1